MFLRLRWKDTNFLCWYKKTLGIWQSVWLEFVQTQYIEYFSYETNIDSGQVEYEIQLDNYVNEKLMIELEVFYQERLLTKVSYDINSIVSHLSFSALDKEATFALHHWDITSPNLYDVIIYLKKDNQIIDSISTYFGMRKIERLNRKVYLNNNEIYQKLILDQGYSKDEGLSLSSKTLHDDVLLIKKMGFNGVRKHQKVENYHFMYLCDYYGLLMWAEMPSMYRFNSLSIDNTIAEFSSFIRKHQNHPSVIVYTLLNESWGIYGISSEAKQQNFVLGLTYLIKGYDSTRLVVGNDGWENIGGDLVGIHDYTQNYQDFKKYENKREEIVYGSISNTSGKKTFVKGYEDEHLPILISEFGGIAFEKENSKDAWGYGERLNDSELVLERFSKLCDAITNIDDVVGFCYTQLSDVQQEVNGLLDENHQPKFEIERIKEVLDRVTTSGFIFK